MRLPVKQKIGGSNPPTQTRLLFIIFFHTKIMSFSFICESYKALSINHILFTVFAWSNINNDLPGFYPCFFLRHPHLLHILLEPVFILHKQYLGSIQPNKKLDKLSKAAKQLYINLSIIIPLLVF